MPAAFDSSTGGLPDGIASGAGSLSGAETGSLLDLIHIATFVIDTEGRIAVWSPAAAELTGHPIEQMLGENVAELFPDESRSRAEELFRRAVGIGGSVGVRSGVGGWVGFLPVLRGDGTVFD